MWRGYAGTKSYNDFIPSLHVLILFVLTYIQTIFKDQVEMQETFEKVGRKVIRTDALLSTYTKYNIRT